MSTREFEHAATVVEVVAPQGLGFGEGGISVADQLERGILTKEAIHHVHETLMHDGAAFKKVEADDDGCGDGRPWQKIIQTVTEGGRRVVPQALLHGKIHRLMWSTRSRLHIQIF